MPVLVARKTITSTQLLALNETPVELVAGVPGKMVWPFNAVLEYVAGGTPYTTNGSTLYITWEGTDQLVQADTNTFLDTNYSQVYVIGYGGSFQDHVTLYDGMALDIRGIGGTDLMDGDGELIVTVPYMLVDLA